MVDSSLATAALHDEPLDGAVPSWAAQVAAGNLPTPISSFVGREAEAAVTAVALHGSRLVTLTGPAGVGKTRLALHVAAGLRPEAPDGAWFVDLAPIADPALVPHAVASVLGLREESPDDLTPALVAHLGRRRVLVVLDNAEHLVEACAELAHRLLTSCPAVSVLATSREPLRIPGERVVAVGPLGVPRPGDLEPATAEESPSVRLFLERAVSTRPEFAIDDDAVAATVAEICRRLEGIPLAIELAAARIHALSPAEILSKLEDRFRFLTRGDRIAVRRHQTLEAALDWSFELLGDDERALLPCLSVFAGPFSAQAGEAVCAGAQMPASQVGTVLEQLVAKSLLVAELTAAGARFRMLETVRDYARAKLGDDDRMALEHAHAARYAALAEEAAARLSGAGQRSSVDQVDTEHDNFRAALAWALARGDAELALRLAGSLAMFWRARGHWNEGGQWLRRALEAGDEVDPSLRAEALRGLGMLAGLTGELETAIPAAEEAAALFAKADDTAGAARALTVLGLVWLVPHPPKALALAGEAIELARRADDRWGLTEALALAGDARLLTGQVGLSHRLFDEALALARAAGDERAVARALIGVAATTGDADRARSSFEEALSIARRLGDPRDVAEALMYLGNQAVAEHQPDRARQLLEECLTVAQEIASPLLRARALGGLGRLALAEERAGTAAFFFDEGIAIARDLGLSFVLVRCLTGRAETAARQRDRGNARRFWEEALEVARTNGDQAAAANTQLCLGILARQDGDDERAATLVHQALLSAHELGLDAVVAAAVAASGGLAVAQGRTATGARLLGAARALSESLAGSLGPLFGADVAAARAALGRQGFDEAWAQGEAMSAAEAVEYASRGRGSRKERPTTGWASLTRAERNVVALVAEGLTTAEMAERLFISPRTVATHVGHIYEKLGISTRRDLARQASSRSGGAA